MKKFDLDNATPEEVDDRIRELNLKAYRIEGRIEVLESMKRWFKICLWVGLGVLVLAIIIPIVIESFS